MGPQGGANLLDVLLDVIGEHGDDLRDRNLLAAAGHRALQDEVLLPGGRDVAQQVGRVAAVGLEEREGGLDGADLAAWEKHIDHEEANLCHQVGCAWPATVFYRLKEHYSDGGDGPLPNEGAEYRTAFCQRHSQRGDCGSEDRDSNYELLAGEPDAVPHVDVRRSATAGPVLIDEVNAELLRDLVRGPKRDQEE